MRLVRTVLRSTSILLAAVLLCCLALALFFPGDWLEQRLEESLNDRLHPLRVDFAGMRPFLKDGPGVSVEGLRLFLNGPGTQGAPDPFFSADRLLLRFSVKDLARRRIVARAILDSPRLRADPAGNGAPSAAALTGALSRSFRRRAAEEEGAGPPLRPGSPAALLPLPAGFTLSDVRIEFRDGSVEAPPSYSISEVQGSLRVESDLSFHLALARGDLRWSMEAEGPFRLSAVLGAEVRGRVPGPTGSRLSATIRLEEPRIERGERAAALSGPVSLTLGLEEEPDGKTLSVPQMVLTGPGLEIRTAGSMRLTDSVEGIDIRDLKARVEDWQPLCSLLFADTALSGRLSLLARRVRIEPGGVSLPGLRGNSFLPTRPRGLSCEGLVLDFTGGRLSRVGPAGAAVSLEGLAVHLEQQENGWTATAESSRLEAAVERAVRYAGPVSAKAEWLDPGSAPKASLDVDLTRGNLAWENLLAKVPDVPLALGVRARVLPGEIRARKAFLRLGNTEWTFEGSLEDPAAPFLNARLAPNTVSLEALAAMSPALQELGLGGRLEIRELALGGRPGALAGSALLKARVTGKDLTVRGTPVKGLYAQALYDARKLTVGPVVLQPATGMINASFSAGFSGEEPAEAGLQPSYSGTLEIDHVELNDLLRVVSPGLEGQAHGNADMNLAFRGSGAAWPEAASSLEAQARIFLNRVDLDPQASGEGDSEDGLASTLDRFLQGIDPGASTARQDETFPRKQELLLAENRASGWFTLRDGCISTHNLVAVYRGRAVEIQGSADLEGRLQVEEGKLFSEGRMSPFRLECRLGREPCRPRPDPEDTGQGAAAELSKTLRLLSEGAQGVYGGLSF